MTEREPTEEMILAGIAAANRQMPYINDAQKVLAIWKAMQARATPALPQGEHVMDAMIYGTGFMQDGQRVDPKDVYKQALPQGVDAWAASGQDYDQNIHSNPDAKAWADFFMETFPNCGADHGIMLGWFANAMMAMHDHLLSGMALVPVELLRRAIGREDRMEMVTAFVEIGAIVGAAKEQS